MKNSKLIKLDVETSHDYCEVGGGEQEEKLGFRIKEMIISRHEK
jgi:hypothetical protein